MNREQRQVLAYMREADVLLDPDMGWARLMQSMRGGSCVLGDGQDRHTLSSYQCRGGKITAGFFDGAHYTITRRDVTRWVKTVDPTLIEALRAVRARQRAEADRTEAWCHCPVQRRVKNAECYGRPAYLPPTYHPTLEEDAEHLRIVRRLHAEFDAALQAALMLGAVPQPGEQLELFA